MNYELNSESENCEVFDRELLGKLQAFRSRLDDMLKWNVSVNNYLRDWTDINNLILSFQEERFKALGMQLLAFDSIFKEEIKEIKKDKQE